MSPRGRVWLRGALAALISGAAGGVMTGLGTAVISPDLFNLHNASLLVKVGGIAAAVNAVSGVAAYLKQSPLPTKP